MRCRKLLFVYNSKPDERVKLPQRLSNLMFWCAFSTLQHHQGHSFVNRPINAKLMHNFMCMWSARKILGDMISHFVLSWSRFNVFLLLLLFLLFINSLYFSTKLALSEPARFLHFIPSWSFLSYQAEVVVGQLSSGHIGFGCSWAINHRGIKHYFILDQLWWFGPG